MKFVFAGLLSVEALGIPTTPLAVRLKFADGVLPVLLIKPDKVKAGFIKSMFRLIEKPN
tara:strand:+ start:12286 stop:12462 length:177 start_codon:yes stop_codon:yes gene_type:complete